MDESTFKLEPYTIRSWYEKGSRPTRKYVLCKAKKIHVFGALGRKKITTMTSIKINAEKFLMFLKRLQQKFKKLCIIVDNARWHLTQKIKNFLRNKGVKMVRLLPYSPELNPIEQYWKNIKQHLATKPIYSKERLIVEVRRALRRNIFIPNVNDY